MQRAMGKISYSNGEAVGQDIELRLGILGFKDESGERARPSRETGLIRQTRIIKRAVPVAPRGGNIELNSAVLAPDSYNKDIGESN